MRTRTRGQGRHLNVVRGGPDPRVALSQACSHVHPRHARGLAGRANECVGPCFRLTTGSNASLMRVDVPSLLLSAHILPCKWADQEKQCKGGSGGERARLSWLHGTCRAAVFVSHACVRGAEDCKMGGRGGREPHLERVHCDCPYVTPAKKRGALRIPERAFR